MPKPSSAGGSKKQAATPPDGAVVGSAGNDTIDTSGSGGFFSTDGDDVIWALEGDDWIEAGGGNDTVEAGDGDDVILDGDGDDTVYGGNGNDQFFNGAGSDTFDGGGGKFIDVAVYEGIEGVDYDVFEIIEVTQRGNKTIEEVVGYEVHALDGSGDIDTLTDVEQILFVQTPDADTVVTGSDFANVLFNEDVTVDVLANDFVEGQDYGVGLTLTDILDIQIDIDGVPGNDVDLVPDGVDLSYFTAPGGGLLNDGSILFVNPDNTITWDPNGVYDVAPELGEANPSVSIWYEATDTNGNSAYGDLNMQVTYPTPAGDVQFEDMVGVYDDFTASLTGLYIYQDGPNGDYWVSQLNSATQYFEERDVAAADDFDYDDDGDDEFRVWTDADGTTHEMNIQHSAGETFDLGGMVISGLDEGEVATISLADASGNIWGQVTATADDLNPDGTLDIIGASNVHQFSVEASEDDEFFVDDVFFL